MRVLVLSGAAVPLATAEALGQAGVEVDVRLLTEGVDAPWHDAVLLDVDELEPDALPACYAIRERSDVPIIIIARAATMRERSLGLDIGADDVVVRPIAVRELLARTRAVVRRRHASLASPSTTLGPLHIDRRQCEVYLDGRQLALTPKEYELLALLALDPGAAFSRARILHTAWADWFSAGKTLDVHVSALRKKLGDPGWIRTIRGIGFCLAVPGAAAAPVDGARAVLR